MHSGDDKDKDAMQRWADALPSYESTYQSDKVRGADEPGTSEASEASEAPEAPDLEALEKFDWREDDEASPKRNYSGLAILIGVALLIVPDVVARIGGLLSITFGLFMVFRKHPGEDQGKSSSGPESRPMPMTETPRLPEDSDLDESADLADEVHTGEMFAADEMFDGEDMPETKAVFGRKMRYGSDEKPAAEEEPKKEKAPMPLSRQLVISMLILLAIMGITFMLSSFLFTDVFTNEPGRM